MTMWKPGRNPDKYPATWHEIVLGPPGTRLLAVVERESQVRTMQNKFNAFKACLRTHPLHPTTQALGKRKLRVGSEWSDRGFSVWVRVSWAGDTIELIRKQLA